MRVLVTGADGFVGTHLCRALAQRGDEVLACGSPGRPGGLDVVDERGVLDHFKERKPEGVVHLAGVSSVSWSHQNFAETMRVNVLGTANILEATRRFVPSARVLLIGSGEEYGRLEPRLPARETSTLAPLSPYAASKTAAEAIGRQASTAYGLQVLLLRPFNHLGRGQSPQFVVPSFARQLLSISEGSTRGSVEVGDLTPVRDFLHVADVVDAYLLLLERGESGEVYNICSGQGLSIREILDQLQKFAGTSAEIRIDPNRLRPAEIPWLVGDPRKLETLGWRRRHEIGDALREVLEEYSR
jgi:GDP-4-dehydro-6-deoxy-D-mannose reductase